MLSGFGLLSARLLGVFWVLSSQFCERRDE